MATILFKYYYLIKFELKGIKRIKRINRIRGTMKNYIWKRIKFTIPISILKRKKTLMNVKKYKEVQRNRGKLKKR